MFCSIQSYNSRNLIDEPADRFEYIVVDEFHTRLLQLPIAARTRSADDPAWADGNARTFRSTRCLELVRWTASAEIRLPDAINRRLLCPFQYFGVADSVDLDGLAWQRGGYRIDDLDRLYTGNDIRAKLILEKLCDTVLNVADVRGLAFCVSVAHAEFMARFFNDNGVPAIALSAQSNDEERNSAQQKLRNRSVKFIFRCRSLQRRCRHP